MKWIKFLFLFFFITYSVEAGILFDGVDDQACQEDADSANLPVAYPFTVMAWIKITTFADNDTIVAYNDLTGSQGWRFSLSQTDELEITYTGISTVQSTTLAVPTGEWLFVAVMVDADADATFYLKTANGTWTSQAISSAAVIGTQTANDDLRIGASAGAASCASATGYFDGQIAHVWIYDAELTEAQIKSFGDSKVKRFYTTGTFTTDFPLDDQPDGTSGDGDIFIDRKGGNDLTGIDGADNLGLTAKAEEILTYP